jgi:hypothetical protein
MKTLITFLLCFCLVNATVFSQTNNNSAVATNSASPKFVLTVTEIVLAIAILAVAGTAIYVVVKASSNIPQDNSQVTLVLEKSYDNRTWTPVATNTVVLHGQTPIDVFQEQMTDSMAFYRARQL